MEKVKTCCVCIACDLASETLEDASQFCQVGGKISECAGVKGLKWFGRLGDIRGLIPNLGGEAKRQVGGEIGCGEKKEGVCGDRRGCDGITGVCCRGQHLHGTIAIHLSVIIFFVLHNTHYNNSNTVIKV